MYAVINHLHFNRPTEELTTSVKDKGLPLLATFPGFQDFYFVKEAEDRGVIIILWADRASAEGASKTFGQTWFADNVMPHLASPQQRSAGEVLASHQ